MNTPNPDGDAKKSRFGVHPDVLKLGLVSFLTDLSSEMIFSVFAVFFTTVAGASSALLGLVEGLADLSASSLNYYAGWLSDRTGKRKVFALAGYGLSTLAKLILLISSSIAGLAIFRVIERLGKGFGARHVMPGSLPSLTKAIGAMRLACIRHSTNPAQCWAR